MIQHIVDAKGGLHNRLTGKIKRHMGIEQIESTNAPWEYRSKQNEKDQGAQIDMLIDRQDMVINLCEMKFSMTEYSINVSYANDLRRTPIQFH